MSLIDTSTRKRPRSSFSDWNNLLKKKYNGTTTNPTGSNGSNDIGLIASEDTEMKDNSSVVILDSDDENYEFNDTNDNYDDADDESGMNPEGNNNNINNGVGEEDDDDTESIVILKEYNNGHGHFTDELVSNYNIGSGEPTFEFGYQNNHNNNHHHQNNNHGDLNLNDHDFDDFDSTTTTATTTMGHHDEDGQLLAKLLKNEKIGNDTPIVEDDGMNFIPNMDVHIGVKKRRTNSLPQLPLSQISYRRVSELIKIGEIKPNLVLPNGHSVPSSSSSSYSSTSNSASSYSDSSSLSFYKTTTTNSSTTSPLSPIPQQNKKKINVTDKDGYYIAEPGEYFANGRFKILGLLGQGTFGKVIKALDLMSNETVAIKIIRAIPKYREASKIELRILTTLKNADPENLNNCIHLREVLDYENHICIITDLLDISLYEFLQSNKFKPFPGSQIQAITRQLIRSIAFLHDLKLIHTDLKPENILLTSSDFSKFKKNNKVLKNPLINVIDFGSAIFNDEYHSELVSTRHYRAPEIVLGIGWSFPCDLWSLGCILVELVTGEALFKTHENLEHLAIMEKVLDEPMPNSMIKRIKKNEILKYFKKNPSGFYSHQYQLNYPNVNTETKSIDFLKSLKKLDDSICSKIKLKININMNQSMKKNWEKNHSRNKSLNYETFQFWFYFIDLVKNLLKFDPNERISAIEAMNHPWWDFGTIDEATSALV